MCWKETHHFMWYALKTSLCYTLASQARITLRICAFTQYDQGIVARLQNRWVVLKLQTNREGLDPDCAESGRFFFASHHVFPDRLSVFNIPNEWVADVLACSIYRDLIKTDWQVYCLHVTSLYCCFLKMLKNQKATKMKCLYIYIPKKILDW